MPMPFPPMGGMNVNSLLRFRFDPSTKDATTRKDEHVWPVAVNDGEFQVTIKRRFGYGFPIHILGLFTHRPASELI